MPEVKSGTIKAIDYDPDKRVMTVQFHSSSVPYDFHGIEPEHHAALVGADSIGSHFHQHIKGKFKHSRPIDYD